MLLNDFSAACFQRSEHPKLIVFSPKKDKVSLTSLTKRKLNNIVKQNITHNSEFVDDFGKSQLFFDERAMGFGSTVR